MSLRLGLIGHPVQHSLSPPMHQAAFSFFSLQGSYDLIDIPPEELGTRLDELVKEGFSGWNVTVPHKESVYHWVAGIGNLTAEARMVGAVNTVRITSSGAIHGHNTDLGGFLSALSRLAASRRPSAVSCGSSRAPGAAPPPAMADPGSCEVEPMVLDPNKPASTNDFLPREVTSSGHCFSLEGRTGIILGAGGAARACTVALTMAGYAEIFVVARDAVKSRALCKSIADALSDVVPSRVQLHGCDFSRLPLMAPHLVVNCTPLGLKNEEVPSDIAALIKRIGPHGLFMDTVYSRGKSTKLCQVAAEAGIASGDGKSMLVEQALLAFEYWTGRKPPSELLWTAIDNATQ